MGAFRELFTLLTEVAGTVGARPEEEALLRARAAAVAEEDLGAFDDAAAQLARAVTLTPKDPGLLAAQTRVALAAERWDEADRLLSERAAEAGGLLRAALLGQRAEVLHERRGQPAEAARVCREALDLVPRPAAGARDDAAAGHGTQRVRLLALLAAALCDAGDKAGQAEALGQLSAEAADPAEAARAAVESARLHAGLGHARTAAEALAAALRKNPADASALSGLEGHLDGQDPEAALVAASALEGEKDPRRRLRALEAKVRHLSQPAERVAAAREAARVAESELSQPSAAFVLLAGTAREVPGDAALRSELRRLAGEAGEWEACARVLEELLELAPSEQRLSIARERADLCERRLDWERAAGAWGRVLLLAPGDTEALLALRRIHRARERWGELAEVCAELARRSPEPTGREDALREEAAVAEGRLGNPARAAQAWEGVLEVSPHDAEAATSLERLYEQLDRPQALGSLLEQRLSRGFDAAAAARLAELKRRRLGDPAGALALHGELLRQDPARAVSRDALAEEAVAPGQAGREALEMLDAALRATGDHARRVEVREARLLAVEEPFERARLHAEIRAVLENDMGQAPLAYVAACRAFAEGGPSRAGVAEDLPRLAQLTESEAELPELYGQAALRAEPAEALTLCRMAARLIGGPDAIPAWKRVLALAPNDAQALEKLEGLYAESRSARELLAVARQRAALSGGEERLSHLITAAAQAEALGDPEAAAEAYREIRGGRRPAGSRRWRGWSESCPSGSLARSSWAYWQRWRPASRSPGLGWRSWSRRAGLLEADKDPRRPVEAYAEILAESPREPGAVAGLNRLLERPDAHESAARLLEDVYRAAQDAPGLAALLEVRLATADAAERPLLLAEIAALQERLGDRGAAFGARVRELEDAARLGLDAPGLGPTWSGWRRPPAPGRTWPGPSGPPWRIPSRRGWRWSSSGAWRWCTRTGWVGRTRRRVGSRRWLRRPPHPRCWVRWRGSIVAWALSASWRRPLAGWPRWLQPLRRRRNS